MLVRQLRYENVPNFVLNCLYDMFFRYMVYFVGVFLLDLCSNSI